MYNRAVRLLVRILLNALALYAADFLLEGIVLTGPVAAIVAGLVLGVINAIIRPVLIVLTLPLTLVTLGLFIFVVNAICLALTALVVPGFSVAGFWAALAGALIVTIVSWLLNVAVRDEGRR